MKTSVVIPAFADDRWANLCAAVESVRKQSRTPAEIIIVIDHNNALLQRARDELVGVRVVNNGYVQGASGARNAGIAEASGDVVAFLDDDVAADSRWLEMLLRPFDDPHVVGTGGRLDPRWSTSRPSWLPEEFNWVVGATYRGQPSESSRVRNVWSSNMAVRRVILESIGGFRMGFGKVGNTSRPEDTDLCIRAASSLDGGYWMYEPRATAEHHVPPSRETLRFFLRRCYQEGQGKADLWRLGDASSATSTERFYATRVLPRGVVRGMLEAARGDVSGLARSCMIVIGLLVTALGLARARTRLRRAGAQREVIGRSGNSGPRILVDQSGYDLLNLGDVSMLQACVSRLLTTWPEASVAVFCHDPGLLDRYCPGTTPVPLLRGERSRHPLLTRAQLALAQVDKMLRPYAIGRVPGVRSTDISTPTDVRAAVRWADMVVASGGGYVTDTWWWHASGVLSVLDAAQRLGKPTAMFGQGLGPLTNSLVELQARRVFPRLDALGLRGGTKGTPLARSLGAPVDATAVTGDDALHLVMDHDFVPPANVIGFNVRIADYTGIGSESESVTIIREAMSAAVSQYDAKIRPLPISQYTTSSDLEAIVSCLAGSHASAALVGESEAHDIDSPSSLADMVRDCRVVVTGSYHAGVFALAAGVPVVGISRSPYYDDKFAELASLYPGHVSTVNLRREDAGDVLRHHVEGAWSLSRSQRLGSRSRSLECADRGRRLYEEFAGRAERVLQPRESEAATLGRVRA